MGGLLHLSVLNNRFLNTETVSRPMNPPDVHLLRLEKKLLLGVSDTENTRKFLNPLDSKDNYIATSNNTKLVHWRLKG